MTDFDDRPKWLYIAEWVDPSDNIWDGRERKGICLTLEGALSCFEEHDDPEDPLIATPVDDEDQRDELGPTAWHVHHTSEKPEWEGMLWIHREALLWK